MPELPEVESVRRSLSPRLLGRRVERALLDRADVVTGETTPAALLQGARIARLERLGKHLAILADDERVLVVHLGMSGQLFWLAPRTSPENPSHVHARWRLVDDRAGDAGTLVFRDPRRFGGLWTLPDKPALREHWKALGPDALDVSAAVLEQACARSTRAIKSVLLDQHVLAGVGNIYADEACFRAHIHPRRRARTLRPPEIAALAEEVRAVLARAVAARGSTLRDFVDGEGQPGSYRLEHAVYGRAGQACLLCGSTLRTAVVGGRTTVWCPLCQPGRPSRPLRQVRTAGTRGLRDPAHTTHTRSSTTPRKRA